MKHSKSNNEFMSNKSSVINKSKESKTSKMKAFIRSQSKANIKEVKFENKSNASNNNTTIVYNENNIRPVSTELEPLNVLNASINNNNNNNNNNNKKGNKLNNINNQTFVKVSPNKNKRNEYQSELKKESSKVTTFKSTNTNNNLVSKETTNKTFAKKHTINFNTIKKESSKNLYDASSNNNAINENATKINQGNFESNYIEDKQQEEDKLIENEYKPQKLEARDPTINPEANKVESSNSNNIKVVARFRPLNEFESELVASSSGFICCEYPEDNADINNIDNNNKNNSNIKKAVKIKLNPSFNTNNANPYQLDSIFKSETTQKEIYDSVAKEVLLDVVNGYNGTIFTYGQSGSGKTHTMYGADIYDDELKGIIPRTIDHLFEIIQNSPDDITYQIKFSIIQVYKEIVYDLLSGEKNLKIKESPSRGIFVEGLQEFYIDNMEEFLRLLELSQEQRIVSGTKLNSQSSRSHTIFMLEITSTNKIKNLTKKGCLNLVDLAGTEKVKKTGAVGETLEEAKKINLSLSALGNVIHALTSGENYIPYKDSKLTRILQESLGGNYKTTLLVACSPHSFHLEETISTLKFAQRAKTIKNKVKMNIKLSYDQLLKIIKNYKEDIDKLTGNIEKLKNRIRKLISSGEIASYINNNNNNNNNNYTDNCNNNLNDSNNKVNLEIEDIFNLENIDSEGNLNNNEKAICLAKTNTSIYDKFSNTKNLDKESKLSSSNNLYLRNKNIKSNNDNEDIEDNTSNYESNIKSNKKLIDKFITSDFNIDLGLKEELEEKTELINSLEKQIISLKKELKTYKSSLEEKENIISQNNIDVMSTVKDNYLKLISVLKEKRSVYKTIDPDICITSNDNNIDKFPSNNLNSNFNNEDKSNKINNNDYLNIDLIDKEFFKKWNNILNELKIHGIDFMSQDNINKFTNREDLNLLNNPSTNNNNYVFVNNDNKDLTISKLKLSLDLSSSLTISLINHNKILSKDNETLYNLIENNIDINYDLVNKLVNYSNKNNAYNTNNLRKASFALGSFIKSNNSPLRANNLLKNLKNILSLSIVGKDELNSNLINSSNIFSNNNLNSKKVEKFVDKKTLEINKTLRKQTSTHEENLMREIISIPEDINEKINDGSDKMLHNRSIANLFKDSFKENSKDVENNNNHNNININTQQSRLDSFDNIENLTSYKINNTNNFNNNDNLCNEYSDLLNNALKLKNNNYNKPINNFLKNNNLNSNNLIKNKSSNNNNLVESKINSSLPNSACYHNRSKSTKQLSFLKSNFQNKRKSASNIFNVFNNRNTINQLELVAYNNDHFFKNISKDDALNVMFQLIKSHKTHFNNLKTFVLKSIQETNSLKEYYNSIKNDLDTHIRNNIPVLLSNNKSSQPKQYKNIIYNNINNNQHQNNSTLMTQNSININTGDLEKIEERHSSDSESEVVSNKHFSKLKKRKSDIKKKTLNILNKRPSINNNTYIVNNCNIKEHISNQNIKDSHSNYNMTNLNRM